VKSGHEEAAVRARLPPARFSNDPAVDFRFARAGACSDVLVGEDETGRISGTVMVGHDRHRRWLYDVASTDIAPDFHPMATVVAWMSHAQWKQRTKAAKTRAKWLARVAKRGGAREATWNVKRRHLAMIQDSATKDSATRAVTN
jgi:hypothetical protein